MEDGPLTAAGREDGTGSDLPGESAGTADIVYARHGVPLTLP